MLLSLIGFTINRHEALRLFGLKRRNPEYQGASHGNIGKVFADAAKIKCWHWEYYRRFDFAQISKSVNSHLQISSRPTLLSFGAIHQNGIWKCAHVAVVISASDKVIELLDPLGDLPRMYANANVWLCADDSLRRVRVIGSSYSISHHSKAAVFRWAE